MNKAKAKRYRALLNEHLAVLLVHNGETVKQLEGEDPAGHADPNDRASVETDRAFDLRLRDRDRKLIFKIREALQRIDEGTFGICEDCGQPIDDRRLTARPVTSQCIECKEDQERRENRAREQLAGVAPAAKRAAPARRSARR